MLNFGLGTEDDPVFVGMHDASALVAGATLAAARAVWTGAAQHGASIAGGLHHAMRASASGYCVYNDPAIAISWLLRQGAGRVAYVDVDVHHGDGVQAAFYDDPRVLTISLHEHPAALWPGTGLPSETGGPGAKGSAVNVALPAGTGDAGGCAPSTPSCRRCCASSGRRSWSASTAVIPTGSTRWPTWSCPSTRSAPRTPRSTPWPTRWQEAGGSLPAEAATTCSTSSPERGRTCWPRPPGIRSPPGAYPGRLREHAYRRTGLQAPEFITEGNEPTTRASNPDMIRQFPSTRPSWPPGRPCSPNTE